MQQSIERVRQVIQGRLPDRPPIYDLVRNDAILSHFGGETLTIENASRIVPAAFEPMVDATRPAVKEPDEECERVLEDGRRQVVRRWTTWTQRQSYPSSSAYADHWRGLEKQSWDWTPQDQERMTEYVRSQQALQRQLGEVFVFWSAGASPGLVGIHGEVGLEEFSYYMADSPEIISLRLEYNAVRGALWASNFPEDAGAEAVFLGDDIAFNTAVMVSPVWLRREYFPRLKRVIDAFHDNGIKVLFHSDGNLMEILDDLVDAGIDGLNPIEVLAGMDVGEIHRRHPHLFLAGGIDVSQLLPFGSPEEIRGTVMSSVEAAEGRLMVGSSTEVNDAVPLENYLAMRQAALDFRY